jgi:hypothetical protein
VFSNLKTTESIPEILCVAFFHQKQKKKCWELVSKNGLKNGREITVILIPGFCSTKARKTGTVMATSPIAESLMTAICLIGFDN